MSASEKLQELKEAINEPGLHGMLMRGDNSEEEETLYASLPQIVALVQWAEKFSNMSDCHLWTNKEHPRLLPDLDLLLKDLEIAVTAGGSK